MQHLCYASVSIPESKIKTVTVRMVESSYPFPASDLICLLQEFILVLKNEKKKLTDQSHKQPMFGEMVT